MLETTDIQMSYFETISADRLPTYHEGVGSRIRQGLLEQADAVSFLRDKARQSLADRMDAKLDQIDANRAYVGTEYDKVSLAKKLNANPDLPMIFVVAHVCADAPHASSMMLHADYYQWLDSTVALASKNSAVTWIVKPHPSCSLYGEEGLVEEVVDKYRADHIHICPADLNVKSIGSCADAVVTVYGTAGLEFSCLGVPAVLAGRSFYAGFGFTKDPQTLEDYEHILASIGEISPLVSEQIAKALEVYALWDDQFDWYNPIITSDVLSCIWGSGRDRDLNCAFELMSENLERSDPRSLKLWDFAQSSVMSAS